jgi:hypothetical protein
VHRASADHGVHRADGAGRRPGDHVAHLLINLSMTVIGFAYVVAAVTVASQGAPPEAVVAGELLAGSSHGWDIRWARPRVTGITAPYWPS